MRVGSRWLHYLLADLMDMNVSPEIDGSRLFIDGIKKANEYIKHNAIPKFHKVTFWSLQAAFGERNLKVITLVRNPRDRAVSLAFHNRYHPTSNFKQKSFSSDFEAVKWTALVDTGFRKGNMRQIAHMIPGSYVYKHADLINYIWVDYDTFLANTYDCVYNINKIFALNKDENKIKEVVERHSFKNVTNRETGNESRANLWHRKGISKDWVNWFDKEMIEKTQMEHDLYETCLDIANGY